MATFSLTPLLSPHRSQHRDCADLRERGPTSASPEPVDRHDAGMPSPDQPSKAFPHACWRCQHWAGVIAEVHGRCKRPGSHLQASPATGCAYWAKGRGDAKPIDWVPRAIRLTESPKIWGTPVPIQERPPRFAAAERPACQSDAFAFDQRAEAAAWRAVDALLRGARQRLYGALKAVHRSARLLRSAPLRR